MNAPEGNQSLPAHRLVVGLGSNLEPEKNLCMALDYLAAEDPLLTCSPIYRNGARDQGDTSIYFNLVVQLHTQQSLHQCRRWLKGIEQTLGRSVGKAKHICCDLDMLLFDRLSGNFGTVALPHKDILQRDYVLRPLAELLPEETHPQTGTRFVDHWQGFQHRELSASFRRSLEAVQLDWIAPDN